MKHVLVTGGAGFIGTHLIKQLVESKSNINIVSLDNYLTGKESNHIEGVTYIDGDTRNAMVLLKDYKFDTIYHFGEFSRVFKSYEYFNLASLSCIEGTSAILRLALKDDATLIYSASSSHFGQKDKDLSPYSYIKKQNVELIKMYNHWFGLNSHIFYFFNVYGPGQISEGPYATVLGIWEQQIKNGEPLTIVEPGTQTRYFTRVESIADACIKHNLLEPNQEWLLRSDDETNLIKIIKRLKHTTKWINERPGDRITMPKVNIPRPPHWNHPYKLKDWLDQIK